MTYSEQLKTLTESQAYKIILKSLQKLHKNNNGKAITQKDFVKVAEYLSKKLITSPLTFTNPSRPPKQLDIKKPTYTEAGQKIIDELHTFLKEKKITKIQFLSFEDRIRIKDTWVNAELYTNKGIAKLGWFNTMDGECYFAGALGQLLGAEIFMHYLRGRDVVNLFADNIELLDINGNNMRIHPYYDELIEITENTDS